MILNADNEMLIGSGKTNENPGKFMYVINRFIS